MAFRAFRQPSAGLVLAGAVLLILSVPACSNTDAGQGPPPPSDQSSVTVTPVAATIAVSGSVQLTAVVRDSQGLVVSSPSVSWVSNNPTVASVSGSGMVSGQSAGSMLAIASSLGHSDSSAITVTSTPPGPIAYRSGTYLGGSAEEMIRDVAIDPQGNVVVAGNTRSFDFPATPGAYQTSLGTGGARDSDAFVAKYSPSGALLWATYVGGPNFERAYAVEVDAQGYIVIAGRAGAGLPVTPGVFQPTFMGSPVSGAYDTQDGFVCKLAPDGASLVFCSYFGTADGEIIRDVAVDAQGNIYVAAGAAFGSFPAAWFTGRYQTARAGGLDVVVAKIAPDGSQVLWASYLGGTGDEVGTPSIRVSAAGEPVVSFETGSTDVPTPGGFDGSYNGGTSDLYVGKFSADGTALLFGTYFGGSGNDYSETHGLALAPDGTVYLSGGTSSQDIPGTSGRFQSAYGGGNADIVIGHISATGGSLLAATYVGGSATDGQEGIAVAPTGEVVLGALTLSSDMPLTVSRTPAGGADLVGLIMSSDLTTMIFGDRRGGSGTDTGRGVAWAAGGIWVGGMVESANFPVLNAAQGTYGGVRDGVLTRFGP